MGQPCVPWQFGQQESHTTEIRDAGENQSRTNECRQAEETTMNKPAEQYTDQHERTGHNAHLTLKTYDLHGAALHRQSSLNPCQRATLNNDGLGETFFRELL